MTSRMLAFLATGALFAGACTTTIHNEDDGTTAECQAFADEDSPGSVLLRFRNDTGIGMYLPGTCTGIDYRVTAVTVPDNVSWAYDTSCLQTCEDLQTSGVLNCDACAASPHYVAPGETYEVSWDATGLRTEAMPGSCWLDNAQNGSCTEKVAAPSGTYRVGVTAYSGCTAWDDAPACQCDENGICNGEVSGVTAEAQPTDIAFPSAAVVEITFGPCAFGCAGG